MASSLILKKCVFGVPSVEFLGHSVHSSGIHPLPAKVQTILDFPQPTSRRHFQTFLGLTNFYHRFIPRCAELTDPLNTLLAETMKAAKLLMPRCTSKPQELLHTEHS